MITGWTRKVIMTSLTSRALIFIPRYSGVRPDMRPTMKTVMTTYITIYITPTPFPPGVDCISIPMNEERVGAPEDWASLPLLSQHLPVDEAKSCWYEKHQKDLEDVTRRVRVLERIG